MHQSTQKVEIWNYDHVLSGCFSFLLKLNLYPINALVKIQAILQNLHTSFFTRQDVTFNISLTHKGTRHVRYRIPQLFRNVH